MSDWPAWLQQALTLTATLVPYALWFIFCLFAINWRKMWPTLAEGAWAPLVLLIGLVAVVWSRIQPSHWTIVPGLAIPNLWWQAIALSLIAGLGLFAGWLQIKYGLTPFDVPINVAVEHPGHGHGHDAAPEPPPPGLGRASDDHGHHAHH